MTELDLDAIANLARAALDYGIEEPVQLGADEASAWSSGAAFLATPIPALVAEVRRLREFATDLAENGTRFDLNPTVDSRRGEFAYIEYIGRIDKGVRDRAAALLALGGD